MLSGCTPQEFPPLAGSVLACKANLGEGRSQSQLHLSFKTDCFWPVAALLEGQLWVDIGLWEERVSDDPGWIVVGRK